MHSLRARVFALLLVTCCAAAMAATDAAAQGGVTSPQAEFGHNFGDDYFLANYQQLARYWEKLARESDRMVLDTIGLSAEGRPQLMAIVTSPANHRELGRYRQIAQRLALAEGVDEQEARRLAAEGRAVVWIDGGLHATEVLGAQQLGETLYQMLSRDDAETLRFLDDVIILFVHANPDGHDLVADWYMRHADPLQRTTAGVPRLYQKYIGHDNNRDSYMSTQPETQNMNRILFREWYPQIMYNHHQTGPAGTVMFAPPFRGPFNYNIDPLVIASLDLVGGAMHTRFIAENKPGVTTREGASYSTWWNGGLRTTVYFHNMIGLLTETIGHPTPMEIPFLPARQLPSMTLFAPIEPQPWHFRQSVDYSVTANRAVLDMASRYREQYLFNIWRMGMNSIERGSRDTWTHWPERIERVQSLIAAAGQGANNAGFAGGGGGGGQRSGGATREHWNMLRDPAQRDPRGYIIPADQADLPTAVKFVNTLVHNGIAVHRATAAFTVNGKSYPAGSYVVRSAQAFRPFVMDAFEPQNHPNDIPYPGGPPTAPYDNAGWTVALQMGIEFDRILDGFDGPFEKLESFAKAPAGRVTSAANARGFLISPRYNDAFVAVNRLLAAGDEVYRLPAGFSAGGATFDAGVFYVAAGQGTAARVQAIATDLGIDVAGTATAPRGDALQLGTVRVGLWDRYGGSMPSGWVRWLFEQYEFPFQLVYAPELDAGGLRDKYDVLVFVTGAIPPLREGGGPGGQGFGAPPTRDDVPAEFHAMLGNISAEHTIPQLRAFLEAGGTIVTVGTSTALAEHLGLPVADALVETDANGRTTPLPREKYYVPGSLLEVRIDDSLPIAWGMGERADVMFERSPVFRIGPDAAAKGVRRIAWFDSATPLRSGWAWGQHYLENGVAAIEADVGRGKLYMFGPEITFRAQPHGTFKFLFNGIYNPTASRVTIR